MNKLFVERCCDLDLGCFSLDPVSGPAEEIKASEVREAIAKSKSDKVSGPSGVVLSEMLKAAGESGGAVGDEHLQRCHQGREDSRRLEKAVVG